MSVCVCVGVCAPWLELVDNMALDLVCAVCFILCVCACACVCACVHMQLCVRVRVKVYAGRACEHAVVVYNMFAWWSAIW